MAVARMIVIGLPGATFDHIKPRVAAGELPAFARLLADGAHAQVRDADSDLSDVLAGRVGNVAAAHGKRVAGVQSSQAGEIVHAIERKESDLLWVRFTALATMQQTVWQRIDGCLAEITRRLDDETGLVVLSGARTRAVDSYFFLANWLAEAGFLKMTQHVQPAVTQTLARTGTEVYALVRALRRNGLGWLPRLWPQRSGTAESGPQPCGGPRAAHVAEAPDVAALPAAPHVDWSATRVYGTTTPGGLRVNLRGREAGGVVAPEQFDATCEEVRAALLRFLDPTSGRQVVRAVHAGGDCDLAIEAAEPYDVRGGVGAASIVAAGPDASDVSPNGIFLLAGAAARRGVGLGEIAARDLAPTLLHLIGVPAPSDLGGAVAAAALADGHRGDAVQNGRATPGAQQGVGYQ